MASHTITARTPGVFYRRPTPDAEPYVADGATVAEGDTLGLIEVMKTYREVKADAGGTVSRWLVENEDEVTIGQDLVELDT
ncbi:acetyl-CoA carboxylase [Actinomycetospora sp. TBRC 11914]|uniref:acetyl-CoA carboxylase n=1 Tax=Actinomycetospora sp. TBRC 11914 TaxID=2729387 RepID=UPI00145C6E58|nr:acetyl-CoA carboxylase [Actinomycetospora sp. TBRC 11914]NMO92407.1 biotin carboxyl carrier domain-containing protein [Actinomycetospora sp. TBRC 11914]